MAVVVLKGVNKMKKIITIGIIIIFCILLFTSHAYAADEEYTETYIDDNYTEVYFEIVDVFNSVGITIDDTDDVIREKLSGLSTTQKDILYNNIETFNSLPGRSMFAGDGNDYLNRVATQISDTQPVQQQGTSTSTNNKFSFPSIGELFQKASDFIGLGASGETIGDDDLVDPTLQIGRVLMTIAIIVLLIVTIIMAIKYMIANPEEQGKLKQQLVGLVISAAVIFGAYIIWQITINLLTNVTQ